MGNLFGRNSRRGEEEEFEERLAELVRKVDRLEEAQRKAADASGRAAGQGVETLLENVAALRLDLERKIGSLDKREEEARREQERLRQWEEELRARSEALDDRERRLRQEREEPELEADEGDGPEGEADARGVEEGPGAEEKGGQEEDAPGGGEEEAAPDGRAAAEAVEKRLEELAAALRESAYKDNLIKELHGELQRHRQGMLAEVAKPYLRSVMKIHERLRDTARYYARAEVRAEEDAYGRFLRKVESDVLTVQDMLEDDFGVAYFEAEPGGEFVPREYHALKTVGTADAALAGRVAECLYGGFRSEETGKVVKAAQVTLYKLENENK